MTLVDANAVIRAATRWTLGTRLAFRFCFIYFGLYVITTQMLSSLLIVPTMGVPDLGERAPIRTVVSWTATHVFRLTSPLVITGSGSGDKTFDWVLAFCVLVIAASATVVWSWLDRRREQYTAMHRWFRVFLRFALGSTMVSYGIVKVIPLQMPAPGLTRLVEPFGHFSPMGVLWASIGASRPYEMFAGWVELVGGILLFVPQTALLGALICLIATIQIFTLNMTYDVPVKLFSFHLLLMSLYLLAPDARRLLNVLLLNRGAAPSTDLPLLRTPRRARLVAAAQILFAANLVGLNLHNGAQAWKQNGGGAPKSALYGIWDVEQLSIDGVTRAPLITDYDRWRRVVFDGPNAAAFQRMDDTFLRFRAHVEPGLGTITLTTPNAPSAWAAKGEFTYTREADRLRLEGTLGHQQLQMELRLYERSRFPLESRGFNWVQEYPFNR